MDGWGPWHEHVERGGAYMFRFHADGREQRHVIWQAGTPTFYNDAPCMGDRIMAVWIVVDNENAARHDGPAKVGEQLRTLAMLESEDAAVAWVGAQRDTAKVQRGGYDIDGPVTNISQRIRLQRYSDGHVLATFPDGQQRTYQSQRTATGAVNRWHTAQWRALGHRLNWENVPAYETRFDWEDVANAA